MVIFGKRLNMTLFIWPLLTAREMLFKPIIYKYQNDG
jgi:hypothetical protein